MNPSPIVSPRLETESPTPKPTEKQIISTNPLTSQTNEAITTTEPERKKVNIISIQTKKTSIPIEAPTKAPTDVPTDAPTVDTKSISSQSSLKPTSFAGDDDDAMLLAFTTTYQPTEENVIMSKEGQGLTRSCFSPRQELDYNNVNDNKNYEDTAEILKSTLQKTELLFTFQLETKLIDNPLNIINDVQTSLLDHLSSSILQCTTQESILKNVLHIKPYFVTKLYFSSSDDEEENDSNQMSSFSVRPCKSTNTEATDCIQATMRLFFLSNASSIKRAKYLAFDSLRNIDEKSIVSSPYKYVDGGKVIRAIYIGPSPEDALHTSSLFASTSSHTNNKNTYSTGYSSDATTTHDTNSSSTNDNARKDFIIATTFLSVLIVIGIAILFFVRYKHKQREKGNR